MCKEDADDKADSPAVEGSDSTAVYQAIREMAYGGVLALTTMPVTVVDNGTSVRITNMALIRARAHAPRLRARWYTVNVECAHGSWSRGALSRPDHG